MRYPGVAKVLLIGAVFCHFLPIHVSSENVCIIGSGIGGSSVAYFLQKYASQPVEIEVYEKLGKVGGRLANIYVGSNFFEAGGSIIAEKNEHMQEFVRVLGLKKADSRDDDNSMGIWDGHSFVFQTWRSGNSFLSKKLTKLWNSVLMLWRYGTDLFKMQSHIYELMDRWMEFYDENTPVFETVESMLQYRGLYNDTQRTLEEDLLAKGFSQLIIDELITVITRINYGQNVSMSGLAGAVALAGSGDSLWAVEGGNYRVPAGLIKYSNASLHLNRDVISVAADGDVYQLTFPLSERRQCSAVVIATPLDEVPINFVPSLKLPLRNLQHTYTTFVRGLINPVYFGVEKPLDLPSLIGTIEDPTLPFTCINILKSYSEDDNVYKMFSRVPATDSLLDQLFSKRTETYKIDWAAYPHYSPPEQFAPIVLDGHHLYYLNTFESAASAMEASAVSARNIARLLLSRMKKEGPAHIEVGEDSSEDAAEL